MASSSASEGQNGGGARLRMNSSALDEESLPQFLAPDTGSRSLN